MTGYPLKAVTNLLATSLTVFCVTAGCATAALAQDAKLDARMTAEKEARKACKTEICKAFAEKKADGAPISCTVTKTWLETEIAQSILGGKVSWPWSHAQCTAKIELDRATIAAIVSGPEATTKLKKHDVTCSLDRKAPETGEAYGVKMSISPEVTAKGGKASKVVMGWGDIDAPLLAKGAIWSATATDNTFNVLSGSVVNEINSFVFAKCKDVGVDIPEPK
jgi:hypothetical protein